MILVLCFSLFLEVESTAEAITPGGGGASRDDSLKDSTPITAGDGSTVEIPASNVAAPVVLPTANVGDETLDVNLTASRLIFMPPVDDQNDPVFKLVESDEATITPTKEVVVGASTSVGTAAATSENVTSESLVDTSNNEDQNVPVDLSAETTPSTSAEAPGNLSFNYVFLRSLLIISFLQFV